MMRGTLAEKGLALLGALVLSGCYTYLPVQDPTPGTTVRARLPVESSVAGGAATTRSVDVEGVVVSSGDTLVVATETLTRVGNFREVRTADTLRVASARVESVEERSLSMERTALFTVLVGVGTFALVAGIAGAAGGSDDGGNGGGGVATSISAGTLLGWLGGLLGGR